MITKQAREGYWKSYKRPPEYFVKAAEAQRRRRKENPDKYREINRKAERKRKLRKYGLTLETYEKMLFEQNGLCAICKRENQVLHDWHIDHDHKTGIVRGILCHHCNLLLGNARDTASILLSAVQYLEGELPLRRTS